MKFYHFSYSDIFILLVVVTCGFFVPVSVQAHPVHYTETALHTAHPHSVDTPKKRKKQRKRWWENNRWWVLLTGISLLGGTLFTLGLVWGMRWLWILGMSLTFAIWLYVLLAILLAIIVFNQVNQATD